MKKILFLFFICFTGKIFSQTTTLVANGSVWKYMDNGSNQGTAWYAPGFNDAGWASGPSELGYGDGDEATVVNACGTVTQFPTCSNKYTTTYFRQTISVPNATSFAQFVINLRRDDGIVLYLNGTEIYRNNMPAGTITYSTFASTACSDDGTTVFTTTLAAGTITNGINVLAAEIHQNVGTSSDITFQFQMLGLASLPPATLVKGPYLQVGTPTSMIVRWETNNATDTRLAFGTNSLSLTNTLTNSSSVTSHSVQITGLSPYTKYYYSIGTTSYVIQGDQNNYFQTSPLPGTSGNYRFWVVGDCGNASTNQTNVKNQYVTYNGPNKVTDGWLLLGDNAYSNGANTEFNTEFFGIYQNDVMKKMVLWPTPGNHDYNNGGTTNTTVPYYTIFSTPSAGEAGGQPSGTPAYYSYDYGNIHFISLDSYGTVAGNKMYDTLGAQAVWLKQDLANNNKRWTIAYWHHPPYTMGSHNSDSESDLVAIRSNFIRILERNKVDMIMCGHSHDYERSKLMSGHYGSEGTFTASVHNLSNSSALYDGSANSCPYLKDSVNAKNGTVYVLSGSAGQLGGTQGSFPHAAMYYSDATNGGSLILDIQDNRLDAKWLCADGNIRDKFTIYKDVNSVKSYTVLPAQSTTVTASWPGTYLWNTTATTSSIVASPTSNITYWVKDPNNCVADTFKFKVLPLVDFTATPVYCTDNAVPFIDLSTNNPSAWSWSVSPSSGVSINTSTAQNPIITFANTGVYSVSLVSNNAYGAGLPVTKTISVLASPALTASSTSSMICSGQSATLTVSGASTYSWSNGSNASLTIVSPTVSGNYSVTGSAGNGCSSFTTLSITVNQNPTITASSSASNICSGQSATLTAGGALNYVWMPGSMSGSQVSVSPGISQAYSVSGTDFNNCSATALINVSVTSSPTVSANSATICAGNAATLVATGAAVYTWNPGNITGATISVSPGINTTYTVNGSNGICSDSNTSNVTVNAIPNLTTTATSTNICAGQNTTLTINGALTYTWSNGSNLSSVNVAPLTNTVYSVTGENGNGCTSSASIIVNVNINPTINVVSSGSAICSGQSSTLTVSGASSYTWNPGSLTGTSIIVSPFLNQTYSVTGSFTNSCSDNTTTTIFVTTTPTLSVNSVTVCPGTTATLTASGAGNYTWNPGGSTGSTFTYAPTNNITFTVMGANNNCTGIQTASITIGSSVSIAVNSATICNGQTASLTANGASTYTWSNGSNLSSINVAPITNTVYTVNGSIGNCNGSQTTAVTVNANPNVTASSSSSLICAGESVTLTAGGASTYSWSNNSNLQSIIDSPLNTTTYSVTGLGVNGCKNTASVTVNVSTCTGIGSFSGDNNVISLYPNPNNGSFNAEIKGSDPVNMEVYNIEGKRIDSFKLLPGKNLLKLEVEKGIYFYSISSGNSRIDKGKLIIQ
jgi:PKD repeat protein